jgi:hypothetical protein
MKQVPTRGARKLPADTNTKGEAVGVPKPNDTPTEKLGDTGAQPM